MSGAGIVVDIQTVGLCVDDVGVRTQSIKHALCNVPAGAVRAVQTDLDTLEGVDAQGNQVAHVTVAARHIVHGAANVFPMSKRQLRPVFVEHVELSVNVILDQQQCLFRHLLAVAVDEFDAVIVVRVVTGGNHDAAVEIIHTGDVSHRRCGGDMEQVSICTGCGQTCH